MDHSTTLGMCLLHADYHPMEQDCWSRTMDFYFEHPDLTDAERRDRYALEVEQAMLDAHIRSHALAASCFVPTA
ncbi:hypothetical protein [Streptomyces caniscabiei]|uniref:Uncharacterized protein n=1 Tax=Streptomyces caniscabiei TaxID=2746961 RepID=A0ABU4MZR1_9ACTN|nr:hypothetical protein [Streptomyces caniscabiei]MBE4790307.1 hypothetical protein [Streptomyces caniscabiei]MBE4799464.1 hypothetical protein [Streptomyces caniscabiei]MDX3015164.1 hypothetical protein [Streptomyces caniscabiei]MDX3042607.1 hypothetical protein [Streptomyces caniscabiei]